LIHFVISSSSVCIHKFETPWTSTSSTWCHNWTKFGCYFTF
jgi:hypothetical protein